MQDGKAKSIVGCLTDSLKTQYYYQVRYKLTDRTETKRIIARLKKMGGGYNGSNQEYRDTVLKYWSKFSFRPKRYWFDLYCANSDAYDPRYITDSIWTCYVLRYFNDTLIKSAYANKGMFSKLMPAVKKPETVVKKIGSVYYNGDKEEPISEEEAVRLVESEEHLIIKPSLWSYGGQDIAFYDKDASGKTDITLLFNRFEYGFVAQRLIKQHSDLAKINASSVNTIRVTTFRFQNQIYVLSTVLRMGAAGSRVDNTTSGGSVCPIKPDGWLADKSVNRKSEWTDRHESSGLLFRDIRVPSFDKVIETAKAMHDQLPLFDLVGWDFAVDESGDPVMIEYNLMPEQNQISCGPTFGEMTDEVLCEVFRDRIKKKRYCI